MSTYTKITKHPQTGIYEQATYCDDYFGPHIYGVLFKSDGKTYPLDLVESKQIYDFWKDDVINAYKICRPYEKVEDEEILIFLDAIESQYRNRWKLDPETGNGATRLSRVICHHDEPLDD